MPNISKIKLPNSETIYDIKDANAIEDVSSLSPSDKQYARKHGEWVEINFPSGPMIFKGTLGTGGTISTLPAASASNEGFTYKVITAGTYASKEAKVGDIFISNGNEWILVPSGDEPSGTVTNIATGDGLVGGPITSTGTIALSDETKASLEKADSAVQEADDDGKLYLRYNKSWRRLDWNALFSDTYFINAGETSCTIDFDWQHSIEDIQVRDDRTDEPVICAINYDHGNSKAIVSIDEPYEHNLRIKVLYTYGILL